LDTIQYILLASEYLAVFFSRQVLGLSCQNITQNETKLTLWNWTIWTNITNCDDQCFTSFVEFCTV